MQIALVQSNIIWQDAERNLGHYKTIFEHYGDINDLIVLPEMFTTGFSMQCHELAEPMNGMTHKFLVASAKKYRCAITGSLIIQEGNYYFNRLLWIQPNGQTVWYDKKHLFSMGFEDKNYQAGNERVIVEYNSRKICPLICYDLRFPVWGRNNIGYDMLLYVANWPADRQHAWDVLLKARAIENQCYVVGVNRVGKDGNGIEYSGGSVLIDAWGNEVAKLENQEAVLEVELDFASQDDFRRKFPVLKDADSFELER